MWRSSMARPHAKKPFSPDPGVTLQVLRRLKPLPGPAAFICLDKYMLCEVYKKSGICIRNHCGAEPPRDIEPPGLVTTVGWRDRASTWYAAADRVKTPAIAARGRFRGIRGGRAAPSLPAEARTTSGAGCLAGAVSPVLVRSRGCSGTPSRPNGSIGSKKVDKGKGSGNEKKDKEKLNVRSLV